MADFHEMAKAAKAKSQALVDAAAEKKKAEKDAEEQRLTTAEAFLRENVLPVLKAAAAAFADEGIELIIEETKNWTAVLGGLRPSQPVMAIKFYCYSDAANQLEKKGRFQRDQFHFEHDGKELSWKSAPSEKYGTKFGGGTIEDFAAPFIIKALDSYYEHIRKDS